MYGSVFSRYYVRGKTLLFFFNKQLILHLFYTNTNDGIGITTMFSLWSNEIIKYVKYRSCRIISERAINVARKLITIADGKQRLLNSRARAQKIIVNINSYRMRGV